MQVFYFYFFSRIHYSLAVAKGYNCQVTFSVFKRQLPAIKTTLKPQAAQTHVAREGCNVIYITYVTRRCRVTDDR